MNFEPRRAGGVRAVEAIDPVMVRVQALFKQSALSWKELGRRMGYRIHADQSARQFLSKTTDPRTSMLRRFAAAVGVPVKELFTAEAKERGQPL